MEKGKPLLGNKAVIVLLPFSSTDFMKYDSQHLLQKLSFEAECNQATTEAATFQTHDHSWENF